MKEELIKYFLSPDFKKPVSLETLKDLFKISDEEYNTFCSLITQLENEYLITHNKRNEFASLKYFNLAYGTYHNKGRGFGFVDSEFDSYYILDKDADTAVSNDKVLIKIRQDKDNRLYGIIERIVERGNQSYFGKFKEYKKHYYLSLIDKSLNLDIRINEIDESLNLKPGDYVEVVVDRYFPNHIASGKIIKKLGSPDQKGLDLMSFVYASGIETEFSKESKEELETIEDGLDEEIKKRPMINKTIITIDDVTAKDLDDAVSVIKNNDGTYTLGVYIADVSYFVKEDTFLNEDAYKRGTSVYLPDLVIPMLPEKLSNNLCSLNPHTKKLVMACEMIIDEYGQVLDSNIFEAVIETKERMTYDEVNKIINKDTELTKKYQDILPLINNMVALQEILKNKRIRRGSFDFEDDEVRFILDDKGKLIDIKKRNRGLAEKIIEEFMIVCNETIAETMSYLNVPFIYRVHDKPNIDKLMLTMASFNYDKYPRNDKELAKYLFNVLTEFDPNVDGLSEEEIIKRYAINKQLIRSMAKAIYSSNNIGHFGLQSKCYTHFTSPIRRYPDLIVHRLIKIFLLNKTSKDLGYYENIIDQIANKTTCLEKRAERVERDADDYKKAEYMMSHIGEVYDGIISSVTSYGFYVSLDNTIEGLVRIKDIHDDFYNYLPNYNQFIGQRTKRRFCLGDKVKIRVLDADKGYRTIDFKLVERNRI